MICVRCPICDRLMRSERSADWPDFPFCSARCRLIDLGRWLGEDYRIPPATEGERPAQNEDEHAIP
jgi:endogenous inhibitor of DNA gyrase (YacG/DUF329 family)